MAKQKNTLKEKLSELRKSADKTKEQTLYRVYEEFEACEECAGTLYKDDGSPCICKTDFVLSKGLMACGVGKNYIRVNLRYYRESLPDMSIRLKKGMNGKYARSKFDVNYFTKFLKLYAETFEHRLTDGKGFILCGDCGCGKSGAAIWIAKQLCLKNYKKQFSEQRGSEYTMLFIEAQTILDLIKDTWDPDSDTKHSSKQRLNKLEKVDYLVIDDLGAEYVKSWDWLISILLKTIKTRVNRSLPTVITMNYTPEQMVTRFNETDFPRLSSVLTEKFDIMVLESTVDTRTKNSEKEDLFKKMMSEVKNK